MLSTQNMALQRESSLASEPRSRAREALRARRAGLDGGTVMPEQIGAEEDRALVQRCLDGNAQAIREFQEKFGELIYNFPLRAYRLPADQAGDFYVFAFEGDRLFRRLRTYAGRVPLRSYLAGFVLDHLVLEWKRAERAAETISLDAVSEAELHRAIAQQEPDGASFEARRSWEQALRELSPQKALLLKLLHVEDADFTPEEIRSLARASGKSVAEVIDAVERLRGLVRQREATLRRLDDQLESVQGWIRLYHRRLARLRADAARLAPGTAAAERVQAECRELERKLVWRENQRERLRQQLQARKVTAPYKEIARLLGTTVGNVASQILRVRKEVARYLGGLAALPRDPNRGAEK